VSFAAAPCAIEEDDFVHMDAFSIDTIDAMDEAFARHSLGGSTPTSPTRALSPNGRCAPPPYASAAAARSPPMSAATTPISLPSATSTPRRTRSTRIKEKHARISNEAVAICDSVVPDTAPPTRLLQRRPSLHASDEDMYAGLQQRNSFTGRPASWCATILSDTCSTSSISSGSSDAPPDVSVVPRRCLRRWQNKFHLTELPYYHGILPLADAGRLLMQPGVSVGTFILHFAPTDDGPTTLQFFLSCLNAERHDSFVSHVVLLMDSFGIYLHQLRYPNVQALVLAARSQPMVEDLILGGFVPCTF
jgi:hypothetical protein